MKRYVVLFLGLVLFFGTTGLAFAQGDGEFFYGDYEIAGRFNVAARGGGFFPVMNGKTNYFYEFTDGRYTISPKSKSGWFAGGELTYDLGDYLAVGPEGYYQEYEIKINRAIPNIPRDSKLGTARNSMGFLKFILKCQFDLGDLVFAPYLAAAPGAIFPTFKNSSAVSAAAINIKPKASFASKFSGGFDFYLSDNFALNLEGAYLMATVKTAIERGNFGSPTNDIKGDGWMAGGGLKFKF